MKAPYEFGRVCGEIRRHDPSYDPRWDFADAAKAGCFAEFKAGFEDGFTGKESDDTKGTT